MNSKQKGKRGELAWAHFLTDNGFGARRGQQFSGSPDSPDVICAGLPFHFEVKRVEKLNMRDATAQASGDCGGKPWVVAHKCNNGKWLVTMDAEQWLDLVREALPVVKEETIHE
jgi:Holliday junction resolvase